MYTASLAGSRYIDLLSAVSGVVFLGTPLRGTTIAKLTQWISFLRSIWGKETSSTLLRRLEDQDPYLESVVQGFASLAIARSIPVHCFYETRETRFAKAMLNQQLARLFGSVKVGPQFGDDRDRVLNLTSLFPKIRLALMAKGACHCLMLATQ